MSDVFFQTQCKLFEYSQQIAGNDRQTAACITKGKLILLCVVIEK
jgi:hypothetical protein